jgi:thiamine-phosphate pyrophosphorylase
LGQDDLPVSAARRLCRKAGLKLWVGKSTHEFRQAKEAVEEGADYIGAGPVFATPTKPGYRPAGLDYIKKVKRAGFRIPFVAIGGIDSKNINDVLDAGAGRVAVVRALFNTGDPYDAAKNLYEKIQKHA